MVSKTEPHTSYSIVEGIPVTGVNKASLQPMVQESKLSYIPLPVMSRQITVEASNPSPLRFTLQPILVTAS